MKSFKSINWYLQSWHIISIICVFPILTSIYYYTKKGSILHRMDRNLSREATHVLSQYHVKTGEVSPPGNSSLELTKSRRWAILWDKQGALVGKSDNAPAISKPSSSSKLGDFVWEHDARIYYYTSLQDELVLAVGVPRSTVYKRFNRSLYISLGIALVFGPAIIFGAYHTTKKGLRPINEITETARDIRSGHFHKRIDTEDVKVELLELTSILNEAFERIENTLIIQQKFTSNASHELRTPISILVLELEALADKNRSEDALHESIDNCVIAVKRLEKLTTSLLHVSRLESGEVKIELSPHRIDRVIADAMRNLSPLLATKHILLEQSLAPITVPLCIEQFTLVINNLISNAVAHTAENGLIQVNCAQRNQSVVITVRDNGEGISPEHLPYVFDRLYRADAARSSESYRSGLGLSISQEIVFAHHGQIEVESALGEGATFTITLPLSEG